MLIFIILLLSGLVYLGFYLTKNQPSDTSNQFVFGVAVSLTSGALNLVAIFCLILNFVGKIPEYNSELTRLDREQAIVIESNQQSVNQVIPVLEKYPNFEKSLLTDLKPGNVLILTQSYPELKANEFFMAQADLISYNIDKEKDIKLKKAEVQKQIEIRKFWLFV